MEYHVCIEPVELEFTLGLDILAHGTRIPPHRLILLHAELELALPWLEFNSVRPDARPLHQNSPLRVDILPHGARIIHHGLTRRARIQPHGLTFLHTELESTLSDPEFGITS